MHLKKEMKQRILETISEIGERGATITEITKNLDYERHTVARYLSLMAKEGLLHFKAVGQSKVWFIDSAPLRTLLEGSQENWGYRETVLLDLLSKMPQGIVIVDESYNIQFMNDVVEEIYGSQLGEKFYKNVLGLENPLKIKEVNEVIYRIRDKADVRVTDRLGNILEMKASRIANPDGSLSIIIITEDITERLEREGEMSKLSQAVRQTADIIFITDREGEIEYVNPAFEKTTGYSAEEVLGKNPRILKSGKHDKEFYKDLWETILSGKPYQNVIVDRKKSGKIYYEEKTITPLKDSKGEITHFISTGKDVTERVIRNREFYYDFFENLPIGCHTFGPDRKIMEVNNSELRMLGYEREEMLDREWSDFIIPEQKKKFDSHWKEILDKGIIRDRRYTLVRKDGSSINVSLTANARFDKDAKLMHTRGVVVRLEE